MTQPISNELIKQVMGLSQEDQSYLMGMLIENLDAGENISKEEHQAEWIAEAERRSADLDSGKVQTVPVEQVFEKIQARKRETPSS